MGQRVNIFLQNNYKSSNKIDAIENRIIRYIIEAEAQLIL
jgi:hypothetical protein